MSEYKIPIYYSAGDRLQLYSYTCLSLVGSVIYVVISDVVYKAYLFNCKITDIDRKFNGDHNEYFKEKISNSRIVFSNDLYFLENLIDNDVNCVIDVELTPICKIKDNDIEFILSKLVIKK
jgi:hypothetical protein